MDSVGVSVFGSVVAFVFFGFFIWLFLWFLFLLSGKAILLVLAFAILWGEGLPLPLLHPLGHGSSQAYPRP